MGERPSDRRQRERVERKVARGKRTYRRANRKTASLKPETVVTGYEKALALREPVIAVAKDRIVRDRELREQRAEARR